MLASAVISSRARRPTPSANPAWPDAVIENRPIRNAAPAALLHVLEQGVRVRLGHEHVVHHVVVGAGGGEPEHVPVAAEVDLGARDQHHTHRGQPALGRERGAVVVDLDGARADERRVRAPGAELVAAADAVPAVDPPGGADRAEHPGVDALLAVGEHRGGRVGAGVDRREARRRDVRHRRPAGRAVGVGERLEERRARCVTSTSRPPSSFGTIAQNSSASAIACTAARRGGRRGLGRVGLGLDDRRDRSRAVDDLVVDERSHGRERTDRRDRRRRARVSPSTSSTSASTPTATPTTTSAIRPRSVSSADADEHRALARARRSPSPVAAVRELGARPAPAARSAADAAIRCSTPATSTRSFVRFATSCRIVGDPEVELPQVDGAGDLPRASRRSTRHATPRTPRSGPCAPLSSRDDRPRPAPAGRTAWRP